MYACCSSACPTRKEWVGWYLNVKLIKQEQVKESIQVHLLEHHPFGRLRPPNVSSRGSHRKDSKSQGIHDHPGSFSLWRGGSGIRGVSWGSYSLFSRYKTVVFRIFYC